VLQLALQFDMIAIAGGGFGGVNCTAPVSPPAIVSFTAVDGSNTTGLAAGDQFVIVFDVNTNANGMYAHHMFNVA